MSKNRRQEPGRRLLTHVQARNARNDTSLCSESGCGDREAGNERGPCGGEASGGVTITLKVLLPENAP